MRDIGSANVQGTLYDLLSPRVVGDYIENIGAACQNPDGYAANKIFVAYDSSMNQHLYKTTAQITQGTQITSSNCEQTSLSELLSGSGSSSSLEDLSDTDISSKTAGDIVEYNNSTGKWENTQKLVNLEKSIAPVEDGATLSQAYAIGEKFIRGGVRYKAKTDLASGTQFSSLIINTNYEAADDVSSEIQTLTNLVDCNACTSLDDINNLINLPSKKAIYGEGKIGNLSTSALKTLLGVPFSANYIDVSIEKVPLTGLPMFKFTATNAVTGGSVCVKYGARVSGNDVFTEWLFVDNLVVKNVTITPATGVTFDYNGTYKIGNLVILNFRFILDAGFTVATDAPIATIDAPPLGTSILAPAAMAWDGEVGGLLGIMTNNIIKLATSAHFVAGKSYVVNATYVCS